MRARARRPGAGGRSDARAGAIRAPRSVLDERAIEASHLALAALEQRRRAPARQFPTDEACKDYLAGKRWPDGVRCPRCGAKEKVYALKARPFHWLCKNADCGGRNGYRFSVITRTIFEDTKIGLRLWFKVGYLMLTAKKGISALQVHRVIFGEESGSDHHTSWYMCHRWRAAMQGDAFPLSGVVEVDETHLGGKDRNRHK